MTPWPHLLFNYLWIAPHVLQVVILCVLIQRRLYKKFPLFLLYTSFELFQFGVLFTLVQTRSLYTEGYYNLFSFGSAISTALRFGIIYEVFTRQFSKYSALNELGKSFFRWAVVVLLVVAAIPAVTAPGNDTNRLLAGLSVMDRTVSIMQCGLLVSLFLFSRYFALSWRNCGFGIALGFGIFASVELATSAIRSQFTYRSEFWDFVTMGTYHCCVLIWIFYLVVPERVKQVTPRSLPGHDLEMWNRELQRMLQQ